MPSAFAQKVRQRTQASQLPAQTSACGRLADVAKRVQSEAELRAQHGGPIAPCQPSGHVFGPYEQKIAPTVVAGEWTAASRAELVVDDRPRHVQRAEAMEPGAQVQVHVLAVHHQILVKHLAIL